MMDFNGPDLEIFFICYITDTSIVTMGGLEAIWIGCLVHLLQARKTYQKFGEEITNTTKLFYKFNLCENVCRVYICFKIVGCLNKLLIIQQYLAFMSTVYQYDNLEY